MQMRRNLLTLVLVGIFSAAPALAEIYLTKKEALALAFAKADRFEEDMLIAGDSLRKQSAQLLPFRDPERIISITKAYQGSKFVGYAIFGDVIGKVQPISYLLALNPDKSIRQIEIMAYRESHGGEIRHPKFRSQYVGRRYSEQLRLGNQIENIAGATLSCRNLTDDVRFYLFYLERLLPESKPSKLPTSPETKEESAKKPPRVLDDNDIYARQWHAFGTLLELKVGQDGAKAAEQVMHDYLQRLYRLESTYSLYRENSALKGFNLKAQAGKSMKIAPEDLRIFQAAKAMYQKTDGYFDAAKGSGNWSLSGGQVQAEAGVQLDFAGILKGVVLDEVRLLLEGQGVKRFLLNFGGQVYASGKWRVKIRDLDGGAIKNGPSGEISVENESLAASGFSQWNRGMYSPKSGEGYVAGFNAVYVRHRSPVFADAMSTALYAAGDNAVKFSQAWGVRSMLLAKSGKIQNNGFLRIPNTH